MKTLIAIILFAGLFILWALNYPIWGLISGFLSVVLFGWVIIELELKNQFKN